MPSSAEPAPVRRALRKASRLAARGDVASAESLLRRAAYESTAQPHRAACFRGLAWLLLWARRPAAAAVWQQQAVAASLAAGGLGPADSRLALAVARFTGDTATVESWAAWHRRPPAAPRRTEGVSAGELLDAARLRAACGDWSAAEVLARAAAARTADDGAASESRRFAATAGLLARLRPAGQP